jgi:hypothetical protein
MGDEYDEEKWTPRSRGPREITKKRLSVGPDKSEVKQWQGDVENDDKNGLLSFLELNFSPNLDICCARNKKAAIRALRRDGREDLTTADTPCLSEGR